MSIVINIKIKGLLNRNKRSNNSYQLLKLKKYLSTLILLFILSFNSLFASEPSRSDIVSVVENSLDDSCVNKCNSISGNDISYGKRFSGGYVSGCSLEYSKCYSDGCNPHYWSCTGLPAGSSDAVIVYVGEQEYGPYVRVRNRFYAVYQPFCYLGNDKIDISSTESCGSKVDYFRSKCKARCPYKYVLKINGKEINTVGDLLDSVPTTEFLKVYDPNMVNY